MISIQTHVSLKNYTTFGIEVFADFFTEVFHLHELEKALVYAKENNLAVLFLGGGSNMLFLNNWHGLVIKISLLGISIEELTENHVKVTAKAGENWHQFVQFCLQNNFGGIENLSLIPGNVGTSPIQNIGAYGVEIKDVFHSLKALELNTLTLTDFDLQSCNFGYRESFFKQKGKGKYVITQVSFILTKKNHTLKTHYGTIEEELKKNNIHSPTIKDISNSIISIRKNKLPDPKIIGNAGSFFKNPTLSEEQFLTLYSQYPSIPYYKVPNKEVKLAAAWLIEQAGWKGKRIQDAGVHNNQALVLVNYGNARGQDIYSLSEKIIEDVNKLFQVILEREVNIIS